MAVSTSAKLEALRNALAKSPDRDVLHKYLQKSNTGLLRDAVLVTLHRNWSANPPHRLTELGITTYDRASINHEQPTIAGPHAESLLRKLWCLHLVICSTAHLDSTPTGLDPFHFGRTMYVSQEEALELLHQIWHQPMDEERAASGFRPIVYMTFGANDSVSKMRKTTFDFNPSSLDTTVATLDAQIIPQQAKITRHADASFSYLLQQFRIPVHHPENSGNAAMYATMIATLSALRFELYSAPENKVAKPGQTGRSRCKSAESVVQSLMDWPTPAPPIGVRMYCWRCGSVTHAFVECPNEDLKCSKCEVSVQEWRRKNAGTHTEWLCAFRSG